MEFTKDALTQAASDLVTDWEAAVWTVSLEAPTGVYGTDRRNRPG